MKYKKIYLAFFIIIFSIKGLQSQNIVYISNFFNETIKEQVTYKINVPFKLKYKKIMIKRSEIPSFQAYILTTKKWKEKMELSLSISKNNINYDIKLLEEAGSVLRKTNSEVKFVKVFQKTNDKTGIYHFILLKEININSDVISLILTISGSQLNIENNIEKIIKSFDESSISY